MDRKKVLTLCPFVCYTTGREVTVRGASSYSIFEHAIFYNLKGVTRGIAVARDGCTSLNLRERGDKGEKT
jgi:hypothetical protein